MTEAEWLAFSGAEPPPMMQFLRLLATDRKLTLFAVACCRRIAHLIGEEDCRRLVTVAEAFADGLATEQELGVAEERASLASRGKGSHALYAAIHVGRPYPTWLSIVFTYAAGAAVVGDTDIVPQAQHHRNEQAVLLRDIFGNPFRTVAADPVWLTTTVLQLAGCIYADRAFDRLPILADALQDAGCNSDEILDHCRGGGPHVRGCWVVDLILGKG